MRHRNMQSLSRQAGFTLLEMIVVLVIIGLIMGLVGPRLFGQADKAKVQTANTQVRMLRGALQTMRLDISRWPTEQEGLALLTTKPANADAARGWTGPYLDEAVPLDPWGKPYQYSPQASGDTYHLMTLNCRYGKASADAIIAAVRERHIDVLALQEREQAGDFELTSEWQPVIGVGDGLEA